MYLTKNGGVREAEVKISTLTHTKGHWLNMSSHYFDQPWITYKLRHLSGQI